MKNDLGKVKLLVFYGLISFTECHLTLCCSAVSNVSQVDLNVDSQEKRKEFLKYYVADKKFRRDVSQSKKFGGEETTDTEEEVE